MQNYTTACLVDLGLDYETLKARNSKLIYCSINGFGRIGPKTNDPAYDVVIQAFAGVMAGTQADLPGRRDQDAILLSNTLMTKTADEWEELFNAAHAPVVRVRILDETLEHPQFQSRTVLQDVDGLTGARPAAAFMFDQGGPQIDGPPPRFGADTKAILNELGVSDERLAELVEQKVIAI